MKYLFIILCLLISSCAQININSQTGEFSYFRWGDQQVNDLDIRKTRTGISVKMKHQESKGESEAIIKALEVINRLSK